jgi:hypothetical protein
LSDCAVPAYGIEQTSATHSLGVAVHSVFTWHDDPRSPVWHMPATQNGALELQSERCWQGSPTERAEQKPPTQSGSVWGQLSSDVQSGPAVWIDILSMCRVSPAWHHRDLTSAYTGVRGRWELFA